MALMNKHLPPNVQYGFFSSTFKLIIIQFAKKKRPNIITTIHTVDHWYTRVENFEESENAIYELITNLSNSQTIVFSRSKESNKQIAEFLIEKGFSCKAFTSDLSSQERDETLDKFRNDEIKVLITSDVLSRGIHIPNVHLVINYKTPIRVQNIAVNHIVYKKGQNQNQSMRSFPDCDTYLHRAGRACNLGLSGLCFTIVTDEQDENNLKKFCDTIDIPLNFIEKDELNQLQEKRSIDQNDASKDQGEK